MDGEPYSWRRTLGEHALALVVGLSLLTILLDLPHRDLSEPFHYDGDSLFYLLVARGMTDHGTPYHVPEVGAPFELDLHDFANFPPVHVLLLRALIACGIHSPGPLLNAYFLLTFPLTIITTLAVLRHFRVAYGPALLATILFTFLPYHFTRGVSTLTCYFLVPPALMVVLWVYRGESLFSVTDATGQTRFRLWSGKALLAAGVLLALGLSDVYYSFFTCFLFLLAGLACAWEKRSWKPIGASWLMIGCVATGCILCLTPAVLYAREHGGNHDAMQRSMIDSEHFGMRIAQLLMPVSHHRVPILAYVKQKFNTKLIFLSENENSSLGLLASIGFVMLVIRLLAPARDEERSLWTPLSRLTVFAVLLATIGGFGLLVAAVLPQIRSYNRFSLFIGFFALFALALTLQRLQERWQTTALGRWGMTGLLSALTIVGVLDQTPGNALPMSNTWTSDAAYVAKLEEALPAEAKVYQLPYRVFPEGGRYDHLRLYMHSTQLHFSYPTMRSRPADFWHKELAAKPIDEMLPTLGYAGFEGICLNRVEDLDPAFEKKLAAKLGVQPLVSSDGRFAYYSITEYTRKQRATMTADQWREHEEETLHPVVVSWLRGFMRTPEMYPKDGRWCTRTGTMELCNLGSAPRTIRLRLSLRSGFADPATITIDGPLMRRTATISDHDGDIEETIDVPPGRHKMSFSCDARYFENNERRVFRVMDFKVLPGSRGTERSR